MTELIKVTEKEGKQLVSARELYLGLGYRAADYSRWCKTTIIDNAFFIENEDFVLLRTDAEYSGRGQKAQDYALSLTMAKKIAMMAKTEVGNRYRDYFISCEKKLQEVAAQQFKVPTTFREALLLAAEQQEVIESQQKRIEIMTPKEEFFDAVADSKDAISMNDVAKVLGIKGMGRNNLFEFLRQNNILMQNNAPYQKYVDCGYFRVIEQKFMKNNEQCINTKTLVYQKGLDFIRKTINKQLNNK